MGKFLSRKPPDSDIAQHAVALKIKDPQDLISCIDKTTTNTARQVVRLLYTQSQLMTMTGPEIPTAQREAIRGSPINLKIIFDNYC